MTFSRACNNLSKQFFGTLAVSSVIFLQACGGSSGGGGQPVEGSSAVSISKTSDLTLSWTSSNVVSCEISNNQNTNTISISTDQLAAGQALHQLPANTTFTISCLDSVGSETSTSVTAVSSNQFAQTVGYYGSASNLDNSWAAIVNLTSPISFTDRIDFNSQVDSYCTGLGYIGTVKTQSGSFSTDSVNYLQSSDGIIAGSGPSSKITLIPGDLSFTNVYTNRRNTDSTNGNVGRATIGNNNSSIDQSIASPTSGIDQMVLCQTDVFIKQTSSLPQTISFADAGPVRKVIGLHTGFVNQASGGSGGGAIAYSSSNPAVATVDPATGEAIIVGLGSTTITAIKASDAFVEAQDSYVLNVENPLPITLVSFTKTSDSTLAWQTTGAVSCDISNNENTEVLSVSAEKLAAGNALHALLPTTTFTISCLGETDTTATTSVTNVVTNAFPQTVGYYGTVDSLENSWLAIVNLTAPVTFADLIDFNNQVDTYCSGLGYLGAAKTRTGDFSTDATHFFQNNDGVIGGNGPFSPVTLIPGDLSFTNVYANYRNSNSSSGVAVKTNIGNGTSVLTQFSVPSPTAGVDQMVLCQTDITLNNTGSLPQTINFAEPGPVRKVLNVDANFVNAATGGQGRGVINYVSSNEAVATVNSTTGAVTIIALGTTTITATKASDAFVQAQDSYVLTVDSPQPINLLSFTKTSTQTLNWSTNFAVSCNITNDQNSEVINVGSNSLSAGSALHPLPTATIFTLTCTGETDTTDSVTVSAVGANPFPQTVGYYGSSSSQNNSWAAIVNLTSPIAFTDRIDFNSQVDAYCTGLGYIGAVKTLNGGFSTDPVNYLQTNDGIIAGNGPSKKITLIPGDLTFTNVYTNRRNTDSSNGNAGRATIGNNTSSIVQSIVSPTSGINPMVLCQTDITFNNTTSFPQTITFADAGPVRKVLGLDTDFTNRVSAGLGSGAISYVSSNTAVATVNPGNGSVTLVGLGTTTITATKAADAFVEAQDSYVLNVEAPQPANLISFTKSSPQTLNWSTATAISCEITNNLNSEVINVTADSITSGSALHQLAPGTTFTLSCIGETGGSSSVSVTTEGANLFPETQGYYGSATSVNNSWAAIVNLTTPITYVDSLDFNSLVDNYCTGLGYVGAVKTLNGSFSTDPVFYLQSSDGIITGSGPSSKVTLIPGDVTFTNVYTNRRNSSSSAGNPGRAVIGNNESSINQSITSPTSGVDQMVLCQTDINLGNTTALPQLIVFDTEGTLDKVQTVDTVFTNRASGGKGTGAITYTSSDPSVATVNVDTGEVTLLALGTTTISATKAADEIFQQAQTSYTLNFRLPQPISIQSFVKSSDVSLSWSISSAVSCDITNDQNTVVTPLDINQLKSATVLHGMPLATTFTLNCLGETGTTASLSASTVAVNQFPNNLGYYGSSSSFNNSWTTMVNLTSPLVFTDNVDFNAQVDNYCVGLGYIGAAKTLSGDFSAHTDYYLQSSDGIIAGSGPSRKVTLIPGDATFSNVYTNRRNNLNTSFGAAGRATIGSNASTIVTNITSPTTGVDPMVLCQTDLSVQNSILIPQSISFNDIGPVNKLTTDTAFRNNVTQELGTTTLIYSSSNPAVATINSTGLVTITGVGTTTITATKPGEAQFIESSANYILNVN